MSFPQTRLTLIRRLATGGNDRDWHQFLHDYWGPICGFAIGWGGLSIHDAEDVASRTFEALLRRDLLSRWQDSPTARLRTLLCSVAKNVISNQARIEKGRKRIRDEWAEQPPAAGGVLVGDSADPTTDQVDTFYAAWVTDLLRHCIEDLLVDLHGAGKGDYFRVLYGRLCEQLSTVEIAELLQIKTSTVENYYKAAKKRLAEELETAVRRHVERYCQEESSDEEFRVEWAQLSDYLQRHGGLEQAVRDGHQRAAEISASLQSASYRNTKSRFMLAPASQAASSGNSEPPH